MASPIVICPSALSTGLKRCASNVQVIIGRGKRALLLENLDGVLKVALTQSLNRKSNELTQVLKVREADNLVGAARA